MCRTVARPGPVQDWAAGAASLFTLPATVATDWDRQRAALGFDRRNRVLDSTFSGCVLRFLGGVVRFELLNKIFLTADDESTYATLPA